MAVGWVDDDNHQEEIEATVNNGIDHARAQLGKGSSRTHCLDCGDPIPEGRRSAVNGVRYCVGCQYHHDVRLGAWYNRRGSKDSQLR